MKAQPSSVRMPEQTMLSAWCEQLAQATPDLSQTLVGQEPELLPRFAAYYAQLQQLPRRVRRRLQRQCRRVRRARHLSVARTHPTSILRSAQRRCAQSLAGVALLLALGQAPALAATINVGGGCKLVDAITAANTDNAIGLCKAGSGADTLVLSSSSTHTLTAVNNTGYGSNGLPVITSVITIAGNNSTIARSQITGTPDFRLLAVASTGKLTLRGITLKGGVASGDNLGNRGGAVFNSGNLAITDSTVSGNTAANAGGGVFTLNSGAVTTLTNSTVSGNSARYCGGVCTLLGTAILTNSTVSDNTASLSAGGVSQNRGALTVINSTVSGNMVSNGSGGGVLNQASTMTLANSTVSGNKAHRGAGVANFNGALTATNSTISGNTASGYGGGALNAVGRMTFINSAVSGNTGGAKGGGVYSAGRSGNLRSDVVLSRTLISGNIATSGAEIFQANGGVVTDNDFNLFGHSGLTSAQALVGFAPGSFSSTATSDGSVPTALTSILNPTLANNGGLTRTHALVANSPAVDETNGCPPPATDQRGVPRPQINGAPQCDVGAFELVPPGTVTCDGLPATIIGSSASQTLTGTPGPDVIQGLGGNDVIRGLAGNDVLCGGPGNDRVLGGTGDDRLFGDADKDSLSGESGFDRCDGGPPAKGDTAASCEQLSNVP